MAVRREEEANDLPMLTDGLKWNPHHNDCGRGHVVHETVLVPIEFGDLTFDLEVYNSPRYNNTDPPTFCHGDDGVATGLICNKLWEEYETRLVVDILGNEPPGIVLDFGVNVGWYTVIAAKLGHTVIGWEMEPETLALCQRNLARSGVSATLIQGFIDDDAPRLHADADVLFVKADVESHEFGVVEACWDLFEQRRIKYALLEISPVFRPGYAALLSSIIALGYKAYVVPDCRSERRDEFNAAPLSDLQTRMVTDPVQFVEAISQRNVLMVRT